ncbi:MAG: Rho termination factor N-terminal domain-containing protein [Thermoleophilaceae bacterium]
MSVLQRTELEESPLADLHAIASELGIEGYRALGRDDLVAAILKAQGGDSADAGDAEADAGGSGSDTGDAEDDAGDAGDEERDSGGDDGGADGRDDAGEPRAARARGRGRASRRDSEEEDGGSAETVTGLLDILPNGSGFIRASETGQSSGDVYVSSAQIRRCELRAGDEVTGPVRPPRRRERHPSLLRVSSVNGVDAEAPDRRPGFGSLTPVHPTERLPAPPALDTVPFGKGSRVAIAGAPGAGATRLLREIARGLADSGGDLVVAVALVGARPEEVTEWEREEGIVVTGGAFDGSLEEQTQSAELVVERAKRTVEGGGDAVVVMDSLEALPSAPARRLFGAGRRVEQGGSLTVIAAIGNSLEAMRQASTRVTLDAVTAEPTVLAARSSTQRADLLV